jgi:predicted membrane protein
MDDFLKLILIAIFFIIKTIVLAILLAIGFRIGGLIFDTKYNQYQERKLKKQKALTA